MIKTISFRFFLLGMLLFLNGCNLSEVNKEEDIFQFKGSYVGDAGAVGNITYLLPEPNGEQSSGLELKTTDKPYGVILNYASAGKSKDTATNYEELALYNATFILALVPNADWVTFNFVEQEFVVTRDELQRFYGTDIREFNNEDELNRFIQENLEEEYRVIQFFNEY